MSDEILTVLEVATLLKVADKTVYLLVRREDPDDPRLGGFTLKRWERTETGARFAPVSKDPKFEPILLTLDDEETTTHLARFIEVLHLDDSEVTA